MPAERGELLRRGFEPCDRFAVGDRAARERLFDAELRGEAAVLELELHQRDGDEPWREPVEQRELEAGGASPLGDARVVRGKHLAQALPLGQHRLRLHRLDQARRIRERLVHVDLHDELLGIGICRVGDGREGPVLRPQHVQRAKEIDGVVLAVDGPEHVAPVGRARGRREQCGHEQAGRERAMIHPE